MNSRRKQLLKQDLERLQNERIPKILAGLDADDANSLEDAEALVTSSAKALFELSMNRLTNYVLDEAMKGNKQPLIDVASGRIFER